MLTLLENARKEKHLENIFLNKAQTQLFSGLRNVGPGAIHLKKVHFPRVDGRRLNFLEEEVLMHF